MSELTPEREADIRKVYNAAQRQNYESLLFRSCEVGDLFSEIDRLRAELKALREAAEPFARIRILPGAPDDGSVAGWMDWSLQQTVADVRRLAALLPAKGAAR